MKNNDYQMKCPMCNKEFTAEIGTNHECENCQAEFLIMGDTHNGK